MNLLVGALSMGLVLSLLGLGVYISYRVLDTFDLTVDGSFAFGAVDRGRAADPGDGLVLGISGGIRGGNGGRHSIGNDPSAAGREPAPLGTAGGDGTLLARPADHGRRRHLARLDADAADAGIRMWQTFGGPESGATIFGIEVSARTLATFLAMLPAVGTAVFLVDRFFRTKLGLAMRATGDNAQMARSMGVDDAMVFIAGLAVSNGLVGLSGALFAQYQGFVSIQMSIGNLVTGLAAVAIDEGLLRGRSMSARIGGVVLGSILLRLVVAAAIAAGLPANTLKLVTAVLVLLVLVIPDLVRRRRLAPEARNG